MSNILKTITDAPLGGEPFIQTSGSLLVSLIVTIFLAALMMLIYRLCHDSMTYNNKFNITLMMLSVASTTLLALIQNNPLFSLGALGALSICRIRTNTKDPRDLGFVFWSLAIGISSALGAFAVGLISSAVLSSVTVSYTHLDVYKRQSLQSLLTSLLQHLCQYRKITPCQNHIQFFFVN